MNQRRSKLLLKQARKNSRTGKVIIGEEYNRLKKLHGKKIQTVKRKVSRHQRKKEADQTFMRQLDKQRTGKWPKTIEEQRKFAPKLKAINFKK
jgi:hypothetical protein